jgi:fusaric acid resistance family protein
MAAATTPRLGIDRRLVSIGSAGVREIQHFNRYLVDFLSAEFALKPGRVRIALRVGLETALGIGLMAAMHIENVLGAYVIYNVAASGVPMITPILCFAIIVVEAFGLSASYALSGALAEAPWLMLLFFAVESAAYAYVMQRLKASSVWLMVQVTCLSSFYIVIFAPHEYGWSISSTFGGVAFAFFLMTMFDTLFWPEPAEAMLLVALRHNLEQSRKLLADVSRTYLEGAGTVPLSSTISSLPSHLALLDRSAKEGNDAHREAVLLAFVVTIERIYNEVARLTAVVQVKAPRDIRLLFQPEMQGVLDALDRSLVRLEQYVSDGIHHGSISPLAETAAANAAAFSALDTRVEQLRVLERRETAPEEVSSVGAFVQTLRTIARLLELSPDDTPIPLRPAKREPAMSKLFPLDPETMRYGMKVAIAISIAYITGLTIQRGDMTVILWTIVIAGLPTYGATYRKMWLRLIGAFVGGTLGLAAIIIVSPNFDSVLSYMIVNFIVLALAAYAAQSSNRLNYACRQVGTTFVLIFAGLSPSNDIYEPLWRTWGILLGMIIVTLVFIVLWPEYSTYALMPRLRKMLSSILDLLPGSPHASSEDFVQSTERQLMRTTSEVLEIADDARLEGRTCKLDPNQIVDAAGILRRIAYRAGSIASGRLDTPLPTLPAETIEARERFEAGFRAHLKAWLDHLVSVKEPDSKSAIALAESLDVAPLEQLLRLYTDRISANNYAEVSSWTFEQRSTVFAEINSYERFLVLVAELDFALSHVPLPAVR